jgi:hypothetical protein
MRSPKKVLALPLLLFGPAISMALAALTATAERASADAHSTGTRWCGDSARYDDVTAIGRRILGNTNENSAQIELAIFSVEKYDSRTGPEGLSNDEFCSSHTSVAGVQVATTGEVQRFSMQFGMTSGGGMGGGQLDAADLSLLKLLMGLLPDDHHLVPQPSQRILVSTVRNGTVKIHLYDRQHLPDGVTEMIRMTGSGIGFPAHVFTPSHSWTRKEAAQAKAVPGQFVGDWVANIGRTLAISSDGSLFTAQDHDKENLHIYHTVGGASAPQLVHTIAENPDGRRRIYATSTYFSPDARLLLIVTNRPEVRLFSTSTWEQVTEAGLITPGTIGYIPSADWKLGVIQLEPNQTLLWDGVNHRTVGALKLNGQLSWAVFSPDDQVLTFATKSTEGQTVELTRMSTKTLLDLPELWPVAWHSKLSGPLLWWENGRFLIAGYSADNTVGGLALWDSSSGRLVGTFQGCVNSGESLVLQGNRLLGVCPVIPDYPGGVTDWILDGLKTSVQGEDSRSANK